ncbi:MAG: hypothetical protein OFPI_00280 [Osedax symbiont Rs2]|nr:MAG: hypothetical protein OFPI_00280 [Osedax symbiont Rs2]
MSGFIAAGACTEDTVIGNADFFTQIDPGLFRELMRLDSAVTNPRIRQALIDAMGKVNTDLATWKNLQIENGYALLADVPADKIDGKSIHENDYQRAVYCFAKAEITERYQDYDSSGSGVSKAEEMQATIDDYRRQAILAIRRILGQPQSTIELI